MFYLFMCTRSYEATLGKFAQIKDALVAHVYKAQRCTFKHSINNVWVLKQCVFPER